MKIYLDTGNIEEIQHAAGIGLIDGVTTNPTLIAREGRDFKTVIKEIAKIVSKVTDDFTVSAEVTADDAAGMVKEGLDLAKLDKHVIIKCPMTPEGLNATRLLSQKKIRVNVTLVFSANQALLAAKAGAFVVSPFLGRLDDAGHDGMRLIKNIRTIFDNYGFKTGILAASIRHPLHVLESAKAGADIATIPYGVYKKLFLHPLTDKGIASFKKDWEAFIHG